MEKPIFVYNMGEEGVNVDVDDVHLRDGELRSAQNMQIDPAGGIGGIRRRDGIAAFSSGISGSLTGMIGLPLPDRSQLTRRFYMPLDEEDAGRFRTSTDGTTWADTGANGIEVPQAMADVGSFATGAQVLYSGAMRWLGFNNKLYYPGSDYTLGTTNPTLHVWDGTVDHQICEIPNNPNDPARLPFGVIAMCPYDDSRIVVSIYGDSGGSTTGRVMMLDTTTGSLTQLGPETTLGAVPFALTVYRGEVWCGFVNTSGGAATTVRYCRPEDATWTTDLTTGTALGYCTGLAVFKGELYASFAADTPSSAVIKKRTTAGAWSNVVTSDGTGANNFLGPIAVTPDGLSMIAFWSSVSGGGSPSERFIITTDGASWSTDEDISALSLSINKTGYFVFDTNGDLFWVLKATGSSDKLLKRTAAGVWSVVDTDNLRGPIAWIKI